MARPPLLIRHLHSLEESNKLRNTLITLFLSFLYKSSSAESDTMPVPTVTLNDGRTIETIGFGTWKIPQDECVHQTDQAWEVGFDHIDSAQGEFYDI